MIQTTTTTNGISVESVRTEDMSLAKLIARLQDIVRERPEMANLPVSVRKPHRPRARKQPERHSIMYVSPCPRIVALGNNSRVVDIVLND